MNTYKKRFILAILCVANLLGAERKDALACGGSSAESKPKSKAELNTKLRKAIIMHDHEALQEAVRQGADVNFQSTCKECDEDDCDWDERKHSYCRGNMLTAASYYKLAIMKLLCI